MKSAATPLLILLLLLATSAAQARSLAEALLQSESVNVRLGAARRLAIAPEEKGPDALRKALEDESPEVRAAAADSLGRLGETTSAQAVCRLRGDRDDFVRRTAASALARLGGDGACGGDRVLVRVDVAGDEIYRGFVEEHMLRAILANPKMVMAARTLDATGALVEPAADDGVIPGVELRLVLASSVSQAQAETLVRCELQQVLFELGRTPAREKMLRGSSSTRAEIRLTNFRGGEAQVRENARECLAALVPGVYQGLTTYVQAMR